MNVLVTGGTGSVGSRLLPRLVEAGFDCRALLRPGKTAPAGVTAIEGDLLDPASLAKATEGVDAIVHLAASLRAPDPQQMWAANLEGTRNLIDAAKGGAPKARFIMASTGLVYASDASRPASESDPVAPERDYPASKAAAEALLAQSGLNWSILRFAFVYGDGDGHIAQIPELTARMQLHPASRFSMIHHRDVATFVKMGLAGALDGRIVNTTDDAPMTIFELSAMAGVAVAPVSTPLPNPWAGIMDAALAKSLGFRPEVPTTWLAARDGIL